MKSMKEIKDSYFKKKEEDRKKYLEDNSEIIENFISHCAKINVKLTKENFDYEERIGIIAKYPNLLNKLNVDLEKNDEELISCKLLEKYYTKKSFNAGLLYGSNYIAMAHHFFRRQFDEFANFSPRFIDLFWKIKDENIDFYIALDSDRVKINFNDFSIVELDSWYGASFNKQIQEIPNGLVKLRPPLDIDEFDNSAFFKDVYSLDIKWAEKNGIKTFHAEEIKSEKIIIILNGEKFYPVRYIHAEFDINKKHFRHFDGALHLYKEDEYFQRRESDLNFNEKIDKHLKAKTFKVFKMNGKIEIETWLTYISHFFTGNPLIFEYFEGKYPEHIIDILNKIRKNACT